MNPETFEYEQSLIGKSPIPPLTESNLRDKRMYEARRFDSLARQIEAKKGHCVGNLIWFTKNWNDTDKGYAKYVND